MADQNDERKLDDLLDSALSQYSAVEPRPGLETRILARIRDGAEQPRAPWWGARWVVAGAVATVVVVLVLSVLLFRPAQEPVQMQVRPVAPSLNQEQEGRNPQEAAVEPGKLPKRAPVVRKERRADSQPRQTLAQRDRPPVFPTPMGLSDQDKLMMAYLAQTPKEEIIAQLRAPDPKEEEEFWKDQQPAVARPQR